MVREDDSEEIVKVIEENLEEDAKDNVSEEEEIPLQEEEDLNENPDEEMYSWDEIEYKMNYVRFISKETITEQQMQVVGATLTSHGD